MECLQTSNFLSKKLILWSIQFSHFYTHIFRSPSINQELILKNKNNEGQYYSDQTLPSWNGIFLFLPLLHQRMQSPCLILMKRNKIYIEVFPNSSLEMWSQECARMAMITKFPLISWPLYCIFRLEKKKKKNSLSSYGQRKSNRTKYLC